MAEITLVKRTHLPLSDEQRAALRLALFDMVDGLAETDQKAWRCFWNRILKLGAGEIFQIDTWMPRFGPFHRLHMLVETRVFQAQERIKSFEQFRYWIKLGAGFVDWMPGPKGGVVPVPRSISYKKCDEGTMRQFHDDAIDFLRTPHAQRYLWPALTAELAEASMERILLEFDR